MTTRKPKLALLYIEEHPAPWLQTAAATLDRDAAALCKRQWRDVVVARISAAAQARRH